MKKGYMFLRQTSSSWARCLQADTGIWPLRNHLPNKPQESKLNHSVSATNARSAEKDSKALGLYSTLVFKDDYLSRRACTNSYKPNLAGHHHQLFPTNLAKVFNQLNIATLPGCQMKTSASFLHSFKVRLPLQQEPKKASSPMLLHATKVHQFTKPSHLWWRSWL